MVWEFLFGVALSIAYKRGLVTRVPPIAGYSWMLGALSAIVHFGPVTHNPYVVACRVLPSVRACLSQERLFPAQLFPGCDWSYSNGCS